MAYKFFLDTNVILDMYLGRRDTALPFKLEIKRMKIKCVSSVLAELELFGILKEYSYVKDSIKDNINLDKIISNRKQIEFGENKLQKIAKEYSNMKADYDWIEFYQLNEPAAWSQTLETLARSNIPQTDAIHFVVALQTRCTHFITEDTFLARTGKELRKDVYNSWFSAQQRPTFEGVLVDFLDIDKTLEMLKGNSKTSDLTSDLTVKDKS